MGAGELETISSPFTFFWKFGFAGTFVVGSTALLLAAVSGSGPRPFVWTLGCVFVPISTVLCWRCGRLKKVSIDGDSLVISNYLTQTRVPLSRIVEVTQYWDSNRTVAVQFQDDTPAGRRIIFALVPSRPWFGQHPVVRRLRALAGIGEPRSA